jgi:hypothetical protein
MKNKIITILLILITYVVFGQTSELESKKIVVGLTFSPDYCYRTLKSNPSEQWLIDEQNSYQIPKFGFTTGLNAILKFNQSIALEFGIQFSDKGMQTKNIKVEQADPDQSIPESFHNEWHYYYIDLPVKANYFILKRNLKLFVSAGISTNIFLVQKRVKNEFNPDKTSTYFMSEGFNRLNIVVLLGTGIDYYITEKLNLRFEPIFRYSLTPLNNETIKDYQYSIGANFGLYYKLN